MFRLSYSQHKMIDNLMIFISILLLNSLVQTIELNDKNSNDGQDYFKSLIKKLDSKRNSLEMKKKLNLFENYGLLISDQGSLTHSYGYPSQLPPVDNFQYNIGNYPVDYPFKELKEQKSGFTASQTHRQNVPVPIRSIPKYGSIPFDYQPGNMLDKNDIVQIEPLFNSKQGQWIIYEGTEPVYVIETNQGYPQSVRYPVIPNQIPLDRPGIVLGQSETHRKPIVFPFPQSWYPVIDKPNNPVTIRDGTHKDQGEDYEEESYEYGDDYYDDEDDYYEEYYTDYILGDDEGEDDEQAGDGQREATNAPSTESTVFPSESTNEFDSTEKQYGNIYNNDQYQPGDHELDNKISNEPNLVTKFTESTTETPVPSEQAQTTDHTFQ